MRSIQRCLLCVLAIFYSQAQAEELRYVVRPGDSLWSISSRYLEQMTLLPDLQRHNKVKEPRNLQPGSVIVLPMQWLKRIALEARLLDLRGDVLWLPKGNGTGQRATPGLLLSTGDGLRTGTNSNALLELAGIGKVLLNADSLVHIKAFNRLGDSDTLESRLRIEQGSTENSIIPFRDSASRFEIETPSAIAAVRGTKYRVGVLSNEASRTEVLQGLVDLAAAGRSVDLSGGYGAIVQAGAPPGEARQLPAPPDLSGLPLNYAALPLHIPLPRATGVTAWRTQIAAVAAPDRPLYDLLDTRPQVHVDDLPDGEYLLRVRARDGGGLEGQDAESRIILDARPFPPVLLAPQPDAELIKLAGFRWAELQPPARYRFQLSAQADFVQPLVDEKDIPKSGLKPNVDLTPGTYFWRVATVDGVEGQGPFSDPVPFRILPPPPKPPESLPAKVEEKTLSLSWKAGEPGDHYEVQIGKDAGFTEIVHQETLAEAKLQIPKPVPGVYFTRTRTLSSDGRVGPYSPPQRIDLPAPPRHPWWLLLLLLPFAL